MTTLTPLSPATLLFCDVVGFSKYPSEKQQKLIISLNAEVAKEVFPLLGGYNTRPRCICLPTGDGLLVVILENFESQILFSLLMSLRKWCDWISEREGLAPGCKLRVAVHVGRVSIIPDINRLPNVCGDDINICRRIMDQARPNQVLFSAPAHEAYIGHDHSAFSGFPFTVKEPAIFSPLITITVKHGVQLKVRIMKQERQNLWTEDSPLSPPEVIEGPNAVRVRTQTITDKLNDILRSDRTEVEIYEQATFSTFAIEMLTEKSHGYDERTIRLLNEQKELLQAVLRSKPTRMKVLLRRIPEIPPQEYPEVLVRYATLAKWMDKNLRGNQFVGQSNEDSASKSTVDFYEYTPKEVDYASLFPNRFIVKGSIRVDGYRLRGIPGHGLSLVYYDDEKIAEGMRDLEQVEENFKKQNQNAEIRRKLSIFLPSTDSDH